jgi:putative ABC transport system permease protein
MASLKAMMMDSLVISNICQRPTRALVSIAGISLGVLLVILNTGLVHGIMNDRMRREQSLGAEILFWRSSSSNLSPSSVLSLHVRYAELLQQIPGVRMVSPVARYVQSGSSGIGIEQIDGIEFDTYAAISGLRLVEGRVFQNDDEVIVDELKAEKSQARVGSEIQVFGRKMKVVGIYRPESGARIKMSLQAMQRAQGAPDKCTFIMIKCEDPERQLEVQQRINAALPNNTVQLTREIATGFERSIPGLAGFVNAVLALSTLVSTLVILLAMYTTITERTREIGILKSLGASKSYIIGVIEKEALIISSIGVAVGLVASVAAGWGIERSTTLKLEFRWLWVVVATLIGLAAGLIGALYPAVRAANQDPVKALAYE